ncbi:putative eukaryotic translation initiation factor 2 subunit beta [Daldinia childiae]|uniref:putative eukaryotic translation initiation factor 2 subunit beta n=1 Tax=Daldinia childiae TaxID=326645 RepID=UPI001446F298|nr:putative eukaryotic translation initiation factor 2 subunit beta [Daldinia childiae]KAF3058577.1 putative eukaryotic translation initiation factor 2 subunit beta [Daldinia childiae]
MDATDAADTQEQRPSIPDRKQRKSVVFNSEALVVEPDGKIVTMASEDTKDTALSHTPRTPPLSAALEAFTDAREAAVEDAAPPTEEGGLDLLKKKKKKPKKTEDAEGEEASGAADGAADTGGLDLALKKKKKKKATKADEGDEFAAKLAALDLDKEGGAEGAADTKGEEQSGDMEKGTGIWSHDETKAISYDLLLSRFFSLLAQKNPDHASSGTRSYKIPPPQCLREGNKKTIFANIQEITKRMKRSEEHVTAYLFAELGTNGSVDGSRRLVIKGRFQQKQIENVLRKYIIEYVTCKTCRSPDTELNKGENRLYFITCNSCGSRRSVTAIKTGFSAQVGKRRKMQG